MARRGPDGRSDPVGYAPLLWVDPETGRHNGSETLFVPLALADPLNAARRRLYDQRDRANAWQRAGAVRLQPPCDDGPDPADRAAQLREVQATLKASTAALAARPVDPRPPVERLARPRRRTAAGHAVRVISTALITERKKSVELRTRYSAEEKKTEVKLMDDLIARGQTRVVGLKADWPARIARMHADMPHLAPVIDRIQGCCALSAFARQPLRIPPLLLVGPPGVGKTHFALRLADLLGVPSFVYALESAESVAVLTGSEKHWWNADTGQLFKLIVQGAFANPVVVLDELDKVSSGNQYRPANALHAVLEPATASALRDKCIDLAFDASGVVYIATANRLSPIDDALVSRFELFHIEAPGPRAAVAIARAVAQQVLRELKLTRRFTSPKGEVVQQLALLGSPRRMHKVLAAALGRAIVAGRDHLVVTDLLDAPRRTSPDRPSEGGRQGPVH